MKTEDGRKTRKDGYTCIHLAPNIEISWDQELNILYCDWVGVQSEHELKAAGEKIITLMAAKKCSKVLNDNTRVVGHWYHSVDWTNANWFPRMMEAGLKQFGWICSEDVFTRLSAQRAIPQNDIVRVFSNHDEAFNWLAENV